MICKQKEDGVFLGVLELEVSPVAGQQPQQKDKKRKNKRPKKIIKSDKPNLAYGGSAHRTSGSQN